MDNISNLIKRSFHCLNESNFVLLFKSMVRPPLEQGNVVWAPYKKKYIDAIENVQRRVTRMLPTLRDLSYSERLEKLKLPSLANRRLRSGMIEVYMVISRIYDSDIPNILQLQSAYTARDGNRGHSLKLFHQQWRKSIRGNFFTLRVARTWNSLPSVVEAPSLNAFKNRLDRVWGREPFIYDPRASAPGTATMRDVDLTIEA